MPKQFSKYLGYFCNKFVAKNFQKSPNLVTLQASITFCNYVLNELA